MNIIRIHFNSLLLVMVTSIICGIHGTAHAYLKLPSIFSKGAVLQQLDSVPIWGWSDPNRTIIIEPTWGKETYKVISDNCGKWITNISTPCAGGPYKIKISSPTDTIVLSEILLGEVWLCSGQSNMEWTAKKGIKNAKSEIENANCRDLHIFHIPRIADSYPQNDCNAEWEGSTPEVMSNTSATAYFFARHLIEKLHVPVGIIVSAWGGTPIETWLPSQAFNDGTPCNTEFVQTPYRPTHKSVLYNQMIHPIIPYRIKGCIWYQGEANRMFAPNYGKQMESLIKYWRFLFDNNFYFFYVQIAPYKYKDNYAHFLREQQELVLDRLDRIGMITISDLVTDVKDLHPKNKRGIGERLAHMALDKAYNNFDKAYESPRYKSFKITKDYIEISFSDNLKELPDSQCIYIKGLIITDKRGHNIQPICRISNNTLRIYTTDISAIAYCFDNATIGSLQSDMGIPVLPFHIEL